MPCRYPGHVTKYGCRTKRQAAGRTRRCGLHPRVESSVKNGVAFLDCPAYMGADGSVTCGLPALNVRRRAWPVRRGDDAKIR
jgi:hypothetical protein